MTTIRLTMREAEFLFRHMRFDKKAKEKYPKKPKKWWKGKSQAVREFNKTFRVGKIPLSRPTLDKLITLYPEGISKKPKKIQKRYVEKFEKSDAWKRVKGYRYEKEIKSTILKAWLLLGKTEPLDWTQEDLRKLKEDPTIYDKEGKALDNVLYSPLTKAIKPEHATNLRRFLRRIGRYDLLPVLENVPKRPVGVRKSWYLENEDIIKMINATEDPRVLVAIVIELQCGGRPTPTMNLKVNELKFEQVKDKHGKTFTILNIPMFEPKKKRWVDRYFSQETASLVRMYINDMHLKPSDRLFPNMNTEKFTNYLKKIGRKTNIPLLIKKGAGAYVLRHTYATQASEHDVSAEVVMDMGAWKDWKTVTDHYLYVRKEKKLREQLGLDLETLNFGDWIKQFVPYWEKRYLEIRRFVVKG